MIANAAGIGTVARRGSAQNTLFMTRGTERAVLVLDMSGFSLLTRRHGVIHYLSMVRRMQETVRPIVHDHEGSIVKFEADNGFAVFPDPESAIRAAISPGPSPSRPKVASTVPSTPTT